MLLKALAVFLCTFSMGCGQQPTVKVEFFNDSFERVLLFLKDARGHLHFLEDINAEATKHLNVAQGSVFHAYQEQDLRLMWVSKPLYVGGQHRIWRELVLEAERKALTLVSSGGSTEVLKDEGKGGPLLRLFAVGPEEEAHVALQAGETLVFGESSLRFGEARNGDTVDVSQGNVVCDDDGCTARAAQEVFDSFSPLAHKHVKGSVQVLLMPNGGNNTGKEPVLRATLDPKESVEAVVERTAPILNPFRHFVPQRDWARDVQLFNELGLRVNTLEGVKDGDMLFLVSKDDFWVWPGIYVGRRVTLPHVRNGAGQPIVVETLTLEPRLFAMDHYVTDEEADAIVAAGHEAGLVKSSVTVDASTGKHEEISDVRRSEQVFLHAQKPVIAAFKERTFNLTRVPMHLYEKMQVLHYPPDGKAKYNAHADSFSRGQYPSKNAVKRGINRFITVFSYLSTVPEENGGHTVFPRADVTQSGDVYESARSYGLQPMPHYRDCNKGFRSPAIKGRAVMWYNMKAMGHNDLGPGGEGERATGGSVMLDERSLHGGCELTGTQHKLSSNYWISNSRQGSREAEERGDDAYADSYAH